MIAPGDSIFAIDGRPTVVMSGAVPAWRTIDINTADGVDILQLETGLAAAGFTDGGRMAVDRHVDSRTISAINEWQKALGVTQTSSVPFGEVLFEGSPVTVVAVASTLGAVATPGTALLQVRQGDPYVAISTDASWVSPGTTVPVAIDRTRVTGTVASLTSGIAHVSLAAQSGLVDGASVIVTLTRPKVSHALLVPSTAILTTDLSGPTVTVTARGHTRVVDVDVVASANDTAAVTAKSGSLVAGDNVLTY